jgi:hypothetical protein
MDIERDLEFARKCVMVSTADIVTKTRVDKTLQAIARQTTSEEVAEAIEDLTILSKMWKEIGQPTKEIDLAITALQAYQPWIPVSERLPEKEDADENGHILAYSEGLQRSTICLWYHIIGDNVTTHWRENVEPPKGE